MGRLMPTGQVLGRLSFPQTGLWELRPLKKKVRVEGSWLEMLENPIPTAERKRVL